MLRRWLDWVQDKPADGGSQPPSNPSPTDAEDIPAVIDPAHLTPAEAMRARILALEVQLDEAIRNASSAHHLAKTAIEVHTELVKARKTAINEGYLAEVAADIKRVATTLVRDGFGMTGEAEV